MTRSAHRLSSLDATSTHYDTLGLPSTATQPEIRRAFRSLARELHPDRHHQSAPDQAEAASRRMREVNAAWAVLSSPTAKELYDLDLTLAMARRGPGQTVPGAPVGGGRGGAGTATRPRFATADEAPARYQSGPDGHPVVRGVLWVLVLGVLAAIFVFTAYAAGGSSEEQPPAPTTPTTAAARVQRGDCVRELVGAMDLVDCATPHDAEVLDVVPIGRPCPAPAREVYLPNQQESACLADR